MTKNIIIIDILLDDYQSKREYKACEGFAGKYPGYIYHEAVHIYTLVKGTVSEMSSNLPHRAPCLIYADTL